jgi:uncharacterized protein YjiK
MKQLSIAPWLLAALLGGAACETKSAKGAPGLDSTELAARADRFAHAVAQPDSDSEAPIARWLLPPDLNEISGLALTADGRLLTHGDQRSHVFEIDYRRGVVVKEFAVGQPTVHGDFEAIAVVGDTTVLLTSDGILYFFHEGANSAHVAVAAQDTKLGNECEFEGLAYDPAIHALLLACKNIHTKSLKDALVIYRWTHESGKGPQVSRLTVPLSRVIGSNDWKGLHPSDITIDPLNGNYVIVASREEALVEITPAGNVVSSRPLPGEHSQAEGIAITKDSILIISDERSAGPTAKHENRGPKDESGAITLYRWPLARAPRGTK